MRSPAGPTRCYAPHHRARGVRRVRRPEVPAVRGVQPRLLRDPGHAPGAARGVVVGTAPRAAVRHRPGGRSLRGPEVGGLLPAFIDRVHVLRHPGYDVAYWNLSQRRVSRDGDRWLVNGQELRFAHFSGAVIGSPTVFSRHTAVFNRRNIGELSAVLAHDEHRLAVNGHAHYRTLPYGYSWGGAKNENLHTPAAVQASRGKEAAPTAHLPVARMRGAASFADRPPALVSARQRSSWLSCPGPRRHSGSVASASSAWSRRSSRSASNTRSCARRRGGSSPTGASTWPAAGAGWTTGSWPR